MLDKTERKIEKAGLDATVGYTQGDARDFPSATDPSNTVFLVTVLGEVPDRTRCSASIRRGLRLGG